MITFQFIDHYLCLTQILTFLSLLCCKTWCNSKCCCKCKYAPNASAASVALYCKQTIGRLTSTAGATMDENYFRQKVQLPEKQLFWSSVRMVRVIVSVVSATKIFLIRGALLFNMLAMLLRQFHCRMVTVTQHSSSFALVRLFLPQ